MRVHAWTLLLALIACLQFPAAAREDSRVCRRAEMDFAFDRLHARVKREGLYASHVRGRQECVFYEFYPCDSQWVDVSIRERHDAACEGDPGTSPALDHFRVQKKTGVIEWMDFTSGEYVAFEHLCGFRRCAASAAPASRSASAP